MTKEFAFNGISCSIHLYKEGLRTPVVKTNPVWHEEYTAIDVKHLCTGRVDGAERVKIAFDRWSPEEIEKVVAKVGQDIREIVDKLIKDETNEKILNQTFKKLGFRP